jgi:CHASE1-domain containing sensor protein
MSLATKSTRQFLPFLAVLAIAAVISLTVAAFFTLWSLENQNAKASFDIVAQGRFDALETNVDLTLHSRVSLGAFQDHSGVIDRGEFAGLPKIFASATTPFRRWNGFPGRRSASAPIAKIPRIATA